MSDRGRDQVSAKLGPLYAWRLPSATEAKAEKGAAAGSQPSGPVVLEGAAAQEALAAAGPVEPSGPGGLLDTAGPAGVLGQAVGADDTDGPDEIDPSEARRLWFSQAEEIAALVDQAWELPTSGPPESAAAAAPTAPSDAPQRDATGRVIALATGSPFLMTALSLAHPLQTVRLLRLALRHHRALGEPVQRQMLSLCLPTHLSHPETADLLVEVAQGGATDFARWLGFPLSARGTVEEGENEPLTFLEYGHLTPRLCQIIDDPDASWDSRELATEWLLLSCTMAALPTLRRALSLPHLGVRFRALAVLLHSFSPPEVTADDLQFLVSDLFVHPPQALRNPPVLTRDGLVDYPETLTQAICWLHPPEVATALLRILRAEDVPQALYRGTCDDSWALAALAAAYPDRALPHVDSYLMQPSVLARCSGIAAATHLSEPLARPRLFRAAMDGAPIVAGTARAAWEQLYGEPFEPGIGLGHDAAREAQLELGPLADLLDGPPSALFSSRLSILRSESDAARQAILQVLLDEAPSREALALLTFALTDETLLFKRHRKRLPADRQGLMSLLYRRFGQDGLHALCKLADLYPAPGGTGGLMPLLQLAERGRLRRRDAAPLQALAARRLIADGPEAQRLALLILSYVGTPDSLREVLLDRVVAADRDGLASLAAEVLARRARDPILATELRARIESACRARDYSLLSRWVEALPPRAAWTLRLAQSLLSRFVAVDSDLTIPPDLTTSPATAQITDTAPQPATGMAMALQKAIGRCVEHLHAARRLPADWLDRALAAPEGRAFLVAAPLLQNESDLTPPRRAALVAALRSTAHGGGAALEAAVTLLRLKQETVPDDPRLMQLLQTTHGARRARLLGMMLFRQPLTPLLTPFLNACLCTEDPAEAASIATLLGGATAQRHRAYLRRILPSIRVPSLADHLQRQLGPAPDVSAEPDRYWQDRRPLPRRPRDEHPE